MCGRYTLAASPTELQKRFPDFTIPEALAARYNIAPTQSVPVVKNDAQKTVEFCRWGLIPSWAKDVKVGNRMINARAETLAEKPSFRNSYRRRRCLVLADGFYEWAKGTGGQKTPMYIQLQSGEPFAMAGLWDTWQSPDGHVLSSCTIITIPPNELIAPLHHRMAVILPAERYAQWLDPTEQPPDILASLLKPYPAEAMTVYPVSTLVNSPKNDTPECIAPVQRLI